MEATKAVGESRPHPVSLRVIYRILPRDANRAERPLNQFLSRVTGIFATNLQTSAMYRPRERPLKISNQVTTLHLAVRVSQRTCSTAREELLMTKSIAKSLVPESSFA